jgi:hypothetical protein
MLTLNVSICTSNTTAAGALVWDLPKLYVKEVYEFLKVTRVEAVLPNFTKMANNRRVEMNLFCVDKMVM